MLITFNHIWLKTERLKLNNKHNSMQKYDKKN